jgi:hypothetical protein
MCTGTPGKPLWPYCPWKHGEIILLNSKEDETNRYNKDFISEYPHLFRPMPWYEGRTAEEMPEYVKNKSAIPVTYLKVDEWADDEKGGWDFRCGGRWHQHAWAVEPCTEAEYIAYQNSKK